MEIKIKDMQYNYWKRLLGKRFIWENIKYKDFEGIVGLVILDKLREPLEVSFFGNKVIIADVGYKRLQFAFLNKNFWVTAVYDNNDNLIEHYIDITKNNFLDNDNPYYEDLFLDVVLYNDGKTYILDEDELDEAVKEGIVKEDEYKLANDVLKEVIDYIEKNKEEIIDISNRYLKELGKKIIK